MKTQMTDTIAKTNAPLDMVMTLLSTVFADTVAASEGGICTLNSNCDSHVVSLRCFVPLFDLRGGFKTVPSQAPFCRNQIKPFKDNHQRFCCWFSLSKLYKKFQT